MGTVTAAIVAPGVDARPCKADGRFLWNGRSLFVVSRRRERALTLALCWASACQGAKREAYNVARSTSCDPSDLCHPRPAASRGSWPHQPSTGTRVRSTRWTLHSSRTQLFSRRRTSRRRADHARPSHKHAPRKLESIRRAGTPRPRARPSHLSPPRSASIL
jgi:hypothetical protein